MEFIVKIIKLIIHIVITIYHILVARCLIQNVNVTRHVLSTPHSQDVLNNESREVQSYKEVEGVGGASAEHHLEGPHTALSIGKHRTRGLKRTQAHLRRFGGVWTAVVASDDRSVHRGAGKSRLDDAEKLHSTLNFC